MGSMSDTPQYTYRDSIKFACFDYALNHGLDEEQMIDLFTKAAETVRKTEKTALLNIAQNSEKMLGILGGVLAAGAVLPPVMNLTGNVGYTGGQALRRVREGRVPTVDEVHLNDETAEYERATEEIRRRVLVNWAKQQQERAPSNRRMF